MSNLIDWRDQPYTIGSLVMYPRMSGRSVEMVEGYVEAIEPVERSRFNYETREREPYTDYRVKIARTRSSRFGRYSERVVTLNITENITVVTGE